MQLVTKSPLELARKAARVRIIIAGVDTYSHSLSSPRRARTTPFSVLFVVARVKTLLPFTADMVIIHATIAALDPSTECLISPGLLTP